MSVQLDVVTRLCDALQREAVVYCHWKSNEAIDRSASGENDLDLLISRRDAGRFAAVALEAGFKPTELPASRRLPGIADWFALDPGCERPVHLHAHYQLIVGDDMTKDVHLPFEEAYLQSCTRSGLFLLPDPSYELVLFVVRMALKHFPLDARLMAHGRLAKSEQRELVWLTERADSERCRAIVGEHLPALGVDLYDAILAALQSPPSTIGAARLGAALRRRLASHARHGLAHDSVLKVSRRFRHAFIRKVLRRRVRKRPIAGGRLVAIVGSDGSGKSSAVTYVCNRLGRDLDVRRFHLGKPRRTFLSRALRNAMRAGRLVGLFESTRTPAIVDDSTDMTYPGLAWLLWHTLNGRDRRQTYRDARRFATEGGIAICDRFPLDTLRPTDGRRCDPEAVTGRLAQWLARREVRYYDEIRPPDVLVVLMVDAEVAVDRRHEQDDVFVRGRAKQVQSADWSNTGAIIIDANRDHDAVRGDVLEAVWSAL